MDEKTSCQGVLITIVVENDVYDFHVPFSVWAFGGSLDLEIGSEEDFIVSI